jgi:DNA-binding response OmpR family regulator
VRFTGRKLVELGVKNVLPKPFTGAELLNMVEQLLEEYGPLGEERPEHKAQR